MSLKKEKNIEYENEEAGKLAAIDQNFAVIEFLPDGTIFTANENFCEPEYVNSPAYAQFWQKLNNGEFDAGEYKRIGKNEKEIWIQASYNPIRDLNRNVVKVVKYASDLTKEKEAYNNLVNTFQNADLTKQKSQEASAASEQTAVATEDISAKIGNVQESANQAVSAIASIGEIIEQINQINSSTAGAVEEQFATTREVSRILAETNSSMDAIAKIIKDVNTSAEESSMGAQSTLAASEQLSSLSEKLQVLINEARAS